MPDSANPTIILDNGEYPRKIIEKYKKLGKNRLYYEKVVNDMYYEIH